MSAPVSPPPTSPPAASPPRVASPAPAPESRSSSPERWADAQSLGSFDTRSMDSLDARSLESVEPEPAAEREPAPERPSAPAAEPARADCPPPVPARRDLLARLPVSPPGASEASSVYCTASSEASLVSEEGEVWAGHVAAMRERFESLSRAATPAPPPDALRLPDHLLAD